MLGLSLAFDPLGSYDCSYNPSTVVTNVYVVSVMPSTRGKGKAGDPVGPFSLGRARVRTKVHLSLKMFRKNIRRNPRQIRKARSLMTSRTSLLQNLGPGSMACARNVRALPLISIPAFWRGALRTCHDIVQWRRRGAQYHQAR